MRIRCALSLVAVFLADTAKEISADGPIIALPDVWTNETQDGEQALPNRPPKHKVKVVLNSPIDTWPHAEIPYKISSTATHKEKEIIHKAVMGITSHSCIAFKEVSEGSSPKGDYLYIALNGEGGCYCEEGGYNQGRGRHLISINRLACMSKRTVTILLMYALGFQKEHNRPDRAEYITVHWGNIRNSWARQFSRDLWTHDLLTAERKCAFTGKPDGTDYEGCHSGTLVNAFGVDYDPQSILHFPGSTTNDRLAINTSLPIITLKSSGEPLKPASSLTPLDHLKLNAAYNCPANTAKACYDHINLSEANPQYRISSSNAYHAGCKILFSAPSQIITLETMKFRVPGGNDSIAIYRSNSEDASKLVDSPKGPSVLTSKDYLLIVFKLHALSASYDFKITSSEREPCKEVVFSATNHSMFHERQQYLGIYKADLDAWPGNGKNFPIMRQVSGQYYLSRATHNTKYPWVLASTGCSVCKPGNGRGYAHFGPRQAMFLEDVQIAKKSHVEEKRSEKVWTMECVREAARLNCDEDQLLEKKPGGQMWKDFDPTVGVVISYICPDEISRSHALCQADGKWEYRSGEHAVCYVEKDASTAAVVTSAPPSTTSTATWNSTAYGSSFLNESAATTVQGHAYNGVTTPPYNRTEHITLCTPHTNRIKARPGVKYIIHSPANAVIDKVKCKITLKPEKSSHMIVHTAAPISLQFDANTKRCLEIFKLRKIAKGCHFNAAHTFTSNGPTLILSYKAKQSLRPTNFSFIAYVKEK